MNLVCLSFFIVADNLSPTSEVADSLRKQTDFMLLPGKRISLVLALDLAYVFFEDRMPLKTTQALPSFLR